MLTRGPGGTGAGPRLRGLVDGDADDGRQPDEHVATPEPRAAALLHSADTAEHVTRVVLPALLQGAVVVSDHYVDSTLAAAHGLDEPDRQVETVVRWATQDLRPHLTVLLDVAPSVEQEPGVPADRSGEAPVSRETLRQRFLELAGGEPEHYLVLDAGKDPDEIETRIRDRLRPLLVQAVRRG